MVAKHQLYKNKSPPSKNLYQPLARGSKLSTKNKILLYKTTVRPILTYGVPAWSTTAKAYIRKLAACHNKVLRPKYYKIQKLQKMALGQNSTKSQVATTRKLHVP